MTALTQDRNTLRRDGHQVALFVADATLIHAGAIVCVDANGMAVPGATSATLRAVGVAERRADNLASTGDVRVSCRKGPHKFANSAAADAVDTSDIGADCYIVDDQTVAKTNGTGTRSVAGKVFDVDADGVWVDFR